MNMLQKEIHNALYITHSFVILLIGKGRVYKRSPCTFLRERACELDRNKEVWKNHYYYLNIIYDCILLYEYLYQ